MIEKKYWDLFLSGESGANDFIDYVSAWHEAETNASVYEWLGCTEEQYAILLRYGEHAEKIRANSDPLFALALLRSLQPWKE